MAEIGILIIDDDEQSQTALWHVLDSEGWKLQVVPLASQAMAELSRGAWTLVIVNVALSDLHGPLFSTLKELSRSPALEGTQTRVRVLFLVPQIVAKQAQPVLEIEQLPYTLKPLHLHDFLEKVSDLLLEAKVISQPLRRVRQDLRAGRRRKDKRRSSTQPHAMFASREDYVMTEEEIAEWEKQEEAEQARKKKKTEPGYL